MIKKHGQGDHPPGLLLIRAGKPILLLLVLGLAYLAFYKTFHVGIPCVFRLVTGYKCPGCGMTHAMEAIWNGDFRGAMEYNAMSLTVLPITCIYLLYRVIRRELGDDRDFYFWEYILLFLLLLAVVLYGYFRNQ